MNTVAPTASPRRGTPPRAGRRREFRTDIEGLRAVAVLAVVLYHAEFPGVTGGFVGVDIFFVISGFLITGLLWRDVRTRGHIRLLRFYGARARRLLPASATVIIATAVASCVLLPPLAARSVLGDAIACALYVGNYRFAIEGTDYLAADAAPSPLQHYWTLGVEEQFYLLWPALIIGAAWAVCRTRRSGTAGTPYFLVLAGAAAVSFFISLAWTHSLPSWAFFSLPTRAWELAVGGLVALTATWWHGLSARTAAVAGTGGLLLIVSTCFALDTTTPYPGTAALLPVFGTALVVGAGCAAPGRGVGCTLSAPLMRTIGRVSYSWYLWHWPVLLLAPPLLGHSLSLTGRLGAAAVSFVFAVLTLGLIESPVRFARPLRRSAVRSLVLGAIVTAVAVAVAVGLLMIRPVPVGHGAAAAAVTVTPPAATAAATPAGTVEQMTAEVAAAVTASAGVQAVPSNLSPTLAEAPGDKPEVFGNGCVRSWREVGQAECASGDTASPTTVALVGDSHAAMWSPALEPVARERHWRLETLGKVTCPLMELPITSPYLGRQYSECEQWRTEVMNRLAAERPRLVVVSMSRRYGADFGFTSYDPAWVGGLRLLVSRLRATGAAVLVLGPVPDPRTTVPVCVSGHLDDVQACSPPRPEAVNDAGIAAEAAATTAAGGQYADLTSLFCTAQRCPVIVGNTLVYRDDNHVTVEYAQTLGPVLGAMAASAARNLG